MARATIVKPVSARKPAPERSARSGSAIPRRCTSAATTGNTNSGPIFRRTANKRWIQIGTAPHGLRAVWGSGSTRYAAGNDGVVYSGPPNDPLGTGFQVEPNDLVAKTNFAPILFSIGGNDERCVMTAADFDLTVFFDGTWHAYAHQQGEDPPVADHQEPLRSRRHVGMSA